MPTTPHYWIGLDFHDCFKHRIFDLGYGMTFNPELPYGGAPERIVAKGVWYHRTDITRVSGSKALFIVLYQAQGETPS